MSNILVASLMFLILQTSVYAAEKIRIAYSAGTSSLLFLLAHKKGFLKAEGVDAEVIRMTSNVPVAALVSGEVDYHTVLGTSVRGAIQDCRLESLLLMVRAVGGCWPAVPVSNR
jgi:ABC-type nitrate/sulfonate/bicarbonate transport system substrate-binding protein